MNIFGIHLDTKATLSRVEPIVGDIEAAGRRAVFLNINAADRRKRERALDQIQETLEGDAHASIHFMLHSLAFGSLLPFIAADPEGAVTERQMDMTLRVMAHSLVYWVQGLMYRGLLVRGSRIYALSSGGADRVVLHYGPVSAAKAALESHVRQLALELGPQGIAVNCLRPGVADTPAARLVPGYEEWRDLVLRFNPGGRITEPKDVAKLLVALADPSVTWVSGAMIPVDGGESITI
jgi:NAD(P)-dependent dehydrogenase (short-subunit alcohol dehydrogenase family)